jgi:hypothetical protein
VSARDATPFVSVARGSSSRAPTWSSQTEAEDEDNEDKEHEEESRDFDEIDHRQNYTRNPLNLIAAGAPGELQMSTHQVRVRWARASAMRRGNDLLTFVHRTCGTCGCEDL